MKRFLAVVVALAVTALPVTASALAPALLPVPVSLALAHDDGGFEASTPLDLLASTALPPVLPPAVQFDAPTADVYALEGVAFYLLPQALAPTSIPGAPPPSGLAAAVTTDTYPVTVRIWSQAPAPSTDWVAGDPLDADLKVTGPAWYGLDLKGEKLTFTGSIRVGIYLRDDSAVPVDPVPIPAVPVRLGVDTTAPAGFSFVYDPAAVPPAWTQDLSGNYGIRATVHLVPALTCQGFLPPFNKTITMKHGGRTIPLKAFLSDAAGAPVTRKSLAAMPLVELLYAPDAGTEPIDVTDFVAHPGHCNKGQAFRSLWGGRWMYNLKTRKSLPPGLYTVQMESGDGTEYVVNPTCTGKFVIEAPKPKPVPKGKK